MLSAKQCALLGAISEGPIHGYELMARLRQRGYEQWTEISLPSVYRIIANLEQKSLVKSELRGDTRGAPKKLFALTESGRIALAESLVGHLVNPVRSRSSFDLAIAHVALLDPMAVRKAIEDRLEALQNRYKIMRQRWDEQKPIPWNVEALFVHGEQQFKADNYYLRYILKRLDEESGSE